MYCKIFTPIQVRITNAILNLTQYGSGAVVLPVVANGGDVGELADAGKVAADASFFFRRLHDPI